MRYSLRSLMVGAIVLPPLLVGAVCCLRETSPPLAFLVFGFALLLMIAVYDFVRGY